MLGNKHTIQSNNVSYYVCLYNHNKSDDAVCVEGINVFSVWKKSFCLDSFNRSSIKNMMKY